MSVRSLTMPDSRTLYRQAFHQAGHNVGRYRQISQSQHQDYVLAPYLSALKNFRSRRLVSRFRCGCNGLHVDTGQFKPVEQRGDREQRFCSVCATDTAEDEHQFVFDCPAYSSIRDSFTTILKGPAPTLSCFFSLHDHRVIAQFLHECFKMQICTQVCIELQFDRGCFRGAAALVARLHLQLSLPLC